MPVLEMHQMKPPPYWDTYWCAKEEGAYYLNYLSTTTQWEFPLDIQLMDGVAA